VSGLGIFKFNILLHNVINFMNINYYV
jgi:hypothetical protein